MFLTNIQSIQDIRDTAIILFFIIFGLKYFVNVIYRELLEEDNILRQDLVLFHDVFDIFGRFNMVSLVAFFIIFILYLLIALKTKYLTSSFINYFAKTTIHLNISIIIFMTNIYFAFKQTKCSKYIKWTNILIPTSYYFLIVNNLVLYVLEGGSSKNSFFYLIIVGIISYYIFSISEFLHKILFEIKSRKEKRYCILLNTGENRYGKILWQDDTFYLILDEKDCSKQYINKSNIHKIVQDKSNDSYEKTNNYVKEGHNYLSSTKVSGQNTRRGFMKLLLKYKKHILILSLAIVLIPIFIDHFIIGNSLKSNISNSDWIAFLGGYIGSIIGAITALIGVYLTLIDNRKERNDEYRLNNRAFLNVSDTYSNDLELKDLAYKFKGDKILLTEGYEEKLKEGYTGKCQFITLTNYGPGIIVGGVFKLSFEKDKSLSEIIIEIPNINKDETVHIPVAQEGEALIKQLVLTYITLGKEKVIFTRTYSEDESIKEGYRYELIEDDIIEEEKMALGWIYAAPEHNNAV